MRTLKFIVEGQNLTLNPKCDFDWLIPGSKEPIQAEFVFSKEWRNTTKVVGFYSRLGKEYTPQPLNGKETCEIPIEALQKRIFKLKVIGQNGLVTNRLTIDQKGGKV